MRIHSDDKRLHKRHLVSELLSGIGGFDWDCGNREKCQKHGVPLSVIESLFDRLIAVFPDPAHSTAEQRFTAIGRTGAGRGGARS